MTPKMQAAMRIEEMFDAASDADDEVHVRFARMIEKHHGIGA